MKPWMKILLGVLVVGFVAGLIELIQLRMDVGDVYPPYSSLRSDPLGTRALYESLERLDGMKVERNYRQKVKPATATLMVLGVGQYDLASAVLADNEDLEEFCEAGGRVVIGLLPRSGSSYRKKKMTATTSTSRPATQPTLLGLWGVDIASDGKPVAKTGDGQDGQLEDEDELAWHSGLYFENLDPEWQVLYRWRGEAVLIERPYGKGTIVLASDSYLFSNEAMLKERHAALLARLIGPNSSVVFDEYHLGINEDTGVATLGRRYHLQWLLGAMALLALLFMWKNSTSLVPISAAGQSPARSAVEGKSADEGLVNLLRRSMSPSEILDVCLQEYRLTAAKGNADAKDVQKKLEQVEELLAEHRKGGEKAGKSKRLQRSADVVKIYRRIVEILAQKKIERN